MSKEDMLIAECGAWLGNSHCGQTQTAVSESIASEWLRKHLQEVHGANLTQPSYIHMGWVRPYPLPPQRRGVGRTDDLTV